MKRKYLKSVLILTLPILLAATCNESREKDKKAEGNTQTEKEAPAMQAEEKPAKKDNTEKKMAIIKTKYGNMKVELYDATPQHRDNFVKLVNEGYYKDLLFHRVIRGFMIQGGDPNSRGASPDASLGSGGPGYTVPAEITPELFHKKGALSAARMGDQMNPQRASSGSQFYVVQGQVYTKEQLAAFEKNYGLKFTPEQIEAYTTVGGTPHLDGQYTVFGQVVEGLDVIDKIAAVPTKPGDRPVEDVKMDIELIK